MTGATSGAGTSTLPVHPVLKGFFVVRSLVFCVVFGISLSVPVLFLFGHCIDWLLIPCGIFKLFLYDRC